MTNLLYNYYSTSHPPKQQDGGLMIYKAGWKPYRLPSQAGGSFLSVLKSMAKSLTPIAKSLKPVAEKVGKKLIKIGVHSLKDWAERKNLNEAIQDNLRQAGIESANAVEQYIDSPQQQEGSG